MSTAVHCAVAVLEESREMKLFSFSTERGARRSIDEKWPSTLIRVTYVFIPFMAH